MAYQPEESNLLKRLILLISEQAGVPLASIVSTTRLLQDLGVDGDDAEELLLAYAKAFDVDMTGFEFSKHFRGEPHLFNFWRSKGTEALVPLTIGNLCRSAVARRF